MNKEEREKCEFEVDLDLDLDLRPGLKKGVKNVTFWSEKGSGFGELTGTPPPRISRSTPRGRGGLNI